MLDPNASAGGLGPTRDGGPLPPTIHYVQMPYTLAALSSQPMGGSVGGQGQGVSHQGGEQQPQRQYGVKRVIAAPRHISVGGGAVGGYGGMPPVKIIAGQGGQRIVARTVCGGASVGGGRYKSFPSRTRDFLLSPRCRIWLAPPCRIWLAPPCRIWLCHFCRILLDTFCQIRLAPLSNFVRPFVLNLAGPFLSNLARPPFVEYG